MEGNTIYFPTYFQEDWLELRKGNTACGSLKSSCTEHSSCGTGSLDYGAQCLTDNELAAGVTDATRICRCKSSAHYFTTGVDEQKMLFNHKFQVPEKDDWMQSSEQRVIGGSSQKDVETAAADKENPVVSIVMKRDAVGQATEADCGKPKKGQCRY